MSKYDVELNKIERLLGEDCFIALCETNAIVAGGTLTSIFSGKEVNDFDVYFRNPIDALSFAQKINDSNECSFFHYTDRSVLIKDFGSPIPGGQDVQMIVYKFFNSIDEIFNAFDFTINMAAVEFYLNEEEECKTRITLHDDFLSHLAQRRLVFNSGTDYPMVSDLRVEKYRERGFTISKKEKFKLLLSVNAKNINSWEVLKDELGSMYGLDKNDLFDESKEFSLPEAIEQLELIQWNENIRKLNHPALSDVEKVIHKNSGLKWDELEGRYFKVVRKTETTGVYNSIYRSSYVYVKGQEQSETNHGIYVAEGYRGLVDSCYWSDYGDRIIIEIEKFDDTDVINHGSSRGESIVLKGRYRVVNEYTFDQFKAMVVIQSTLPDVKYANNEFVATEDVIGRFTKSYVLPGWYP